uniref:Uncharacterized protein n=1 Tax=Tanacetum cinerariifolium TaxID=118510 RepID=A0A6L2NUZ9_TANCI|nr:hypothetical protein [Tanacetum cinerariifolium]
MIFDGILRNMDNVSGRFLMYLMFIQTFLDKQIEGLPTHREKYNVSFHIKKVFANMKRISGGSDSLVRATTTASSIEAEQDNGNIDKTQTKATSNEPSSQGNSSGDGPRHQNTMTDTSAHSRYERTSKMSSDSLFARVNTPQSDEERLKHIELMKIYTILQKKVLDLEDDLKRTKIAQQTKIDGFERRVKKLKKKQRSRPHKLKRLYKVGLTAMVISSSDDEALDKDDTSKQERIDEIDADKDIALVSTHDSVSIQDNIVQNEGIEDVGEEEVVEVVTIDKMIIDVVVDSAQVTTAIADIPVSVTETIVTTAPTITAESTKKNVKVTQAPKKKGVMIQEPEETTTTKIAFSQQPQVQDKGKGKTKLIEEPKMPKKRKHQIRADEKLAEKLQAEIDEDDRLERERAQKEQEAKNALINT